MLTYLIFIYFMEPTQNQATTNGTEQSPTSAQPTVNSNAQEVKKIPSWEYSATWDHWLLFPI